jgi:hypothetical protein
MDLASQGTILLGARNMDEQDSSRARSTAPNRPLRISCKTDEGKVSIPPRPALLTPLATLAAANLLPESISALSLHPELYCWIGFSTRTAIYEGVRLRFKGEKKEQSTTQENFRSVIPQVSVS